MWVGGALDMNSGSGESEYVVENDRNEGMSLLVVGTGVAVPVSERGVLADVGCG